MREVSKNENYSLSSYQNLPCNSENLSIYVFQTLCQTFQASVEPIKSHGNLTTNSLITRTNLVKWLHIFMKRRGCFIFNHIEWNMVNIWNDVILFENQTHKTSNWIIFTGIWYFLGAQRGAFDFSLLFLRRCSLKIAKYPFFKPEQQAVTPLWHHYTFKNSFPAWKGWMSIS